MKHIKFDFEEPVIAIERVPNKVFASHRRELSVINDFYADGIIRILNNAGIECRKLRRSSNGYVIIRFCGDYSLTYDSLDAKEIVVVKGNNLIYIADEFGNIADCEDMSQDNTIGQTKEDLR